MPNDLPGGPLAPEAIKDELRRFNEERRKMLDGKPLWPGRRLPIEYTGVGGDVAPPDWER